MTLISGFHPSINGDRKVGTDFFSLFFGTLIGNGVFPNPSTGLQVVEGTGLQTIVRAGRGWINGYFVSNDSDYVLQHDLADGVLKRIDRIVMRLDHAERLIKIEVQKGTFASNPVAPILQRDGGVWELALADVLINNGATQITQANITDQRLNSTVCGIVHGLVEQVDTTTIFNQYQSYFNEWSAEQRQDFEDWFDSIKDILDGDVATNLAQLIATQRLDFDNHLADYVKHPAIVTSTNIANNYVVTLNPAPISYLDGLGLVVTINESSTNETTMNVNNLGAVPIKKADGKPVKNLKANGVYTLRYSVVNSAFILQGEGGIEVENADEVHYVAGENVSSGDICKIVRDTTYSKAETISMNGVTSSSTVKDVSATLDKKYLAVAFHGTSNPYPLKIFKNNNGNLTDITQNIDIYPTFDVEKVEFSGDGRYLAIAQTYIGTSAFWLYKREGDNFVKLANIPEFSYITSFAVNSISWTYNAEYLAITTVNDNPGCAIIKNNFDDTFAVLPKPSLSPSSTFQVIKFSHNGDYLFMSANSSGYYYNMFKRNGDTFTKLATPNSAAGAFVTNAFWSMNDKFLFCGRGGNNNAMVLVRNNDDFNTLTNALTSTRLFNADFSSNNRYVVALTSNSPTLTVYYINNDGTLLKMPNPSTIENAQTGDVAWINNEKFIYFKAPTTTDLYEGFLKRLYKMKYTETMIEEIAIAQEGGSTNDVVETLKIWEESV